MHTYFTMFHRLLVRGGLVLLCAMATAVFALAQDRMVPGPSIGNVTTHGNFIIPTLDVDYRDITTGHRSIMTTDPH